MKRAPDTFRLIPFSTNKARSSFLFSISDCEYKGKVYNDAQQFYDSGNRCMCSNGNATCTPMKCKVETKKGLFRKLVS